MSDGGQPLAVVRIRLADCATQFVAAALDLLVAVEDADELLVDDGILEAGRELRRVAEAGLW